MTRTFIVPTSSDTGQGAAEKALRFAIARLGPSAIAFVALGLAAACSVDVGQLRRPAVDSGSLPADAMDAGVREAAAADARATDSVNALPDHPPDQGPGVEDALVGSGVDATRAMPEVDDVAEGEALNEAGSDWRPDLPAGTGGTFDTGSTGGAGGTGGMAGTGGAIDAGEAGDVDGGGADGMAGIDGAVATDGSGGEVAPLAGLVAWWKFDEAPGSSTASDATGNGNNAALAGLSSTLAWTTGHTGGALKCDGSGGALVNDSASLDAITTGVTISAWVYRSSATTGFSAILSREIGTTGGEHYWLGLSGDNVALYTSDSNATSSTAVPVGAWTHLAATQDRSTARIYVNGTQVLSKSSNAVLKADTSKLTICGNQNNSSGSIDERWKGLVDDLQLYSRVLTATEIAGLAK